jgi:hypothetical protein
MYLAREERDSGSLDHALETLQEIFSAAETNLPVITHGNFRNLGDILSLGARFGNDKFRTS